MNDTDTATTPTTPETPSTPPVEAPAPSETPIAAQAAEIVDEAAAKVQETANSLLEHGRVILQDFVNSRLPNLEKQGHDFAADLKANLDGWLAKVNAHLGVPKA